jgi:hypothetical protein
LLAIVIRGRRASFRMVHQVGNHSAHVGNQIAGLFFYVLPAMPSSLTAAKHASARKRASESSPAGALSTGLTAFSLTHCSTKPAARMNEREFHLRPVQAGEGWSRSLKYKMPMSRTRLTAFAMTMTKSLFKKP